MRPVVNQVSPRRARNPKKKEKSGAESFPLTVTLTDAAYPSGSQPLGNTGICTPQTALRHPGIGDSHTEYSVSNTPDHNSWFPAAILAQRRGIDRWDGSIAAVYFRYRDDEIHYFEGEAWCRMSLRSFYV